jgi:hypothetical protein
LVTTPIGLPLAADGQNMSKDKNWPNYTRLHQAGITLKLFQTKKAVARSQQPFFKHNVT